MSSKVIRHGEVIPMEIRSTISFRYHTITKAINREFWNSVSDSAHSFYVGSYGRGTAIDSSDIDMLVEMPEIEYKRYDSLKGNGQSRLLQTVKNAIISTYSRSCIKADGQVIVIDFTDGVKFEVLPAFSKTDYYGYVTYTYPDTNMGGNWKTTDPKAEQKAMQEKERESNGLLYDTCKHIRSIRDNNYSSYHLSGILIDAFVYDAIQGWHFLREGEQHVDTGVTYEQMLLNYYNRISFNGYMAPGIFAPGSKMPIDTSKGWDVLGKILNYMQ